MMRMCVPVGTSSTSSKRFGTKNNSNFDLSLFVTFFLAFANVIIA